MVPHLPLPGVVIALDDLRIPKARAVAQAAQTGLLPYVSLVECRRIDLSNEEEEVVLDLKAELPQIRDADIRTTERIAVRFSHQDSMSPQILALRSDFPVLPHTNPGARDTPRSLCVYEESYPDVRLTWTAVAFIERIRTWLMRAALGELHGVDQPLEPLLIGTVSYVELPASLQQVRAVRPEPLAASIVQEPGWQPFYRLRRVNQSGKDAFAGTKIVAMLIEGKPHVHGVIRWMPKTLGDLHELMAEVGDDLLADLRARLRMWQGDRHYTSFRNHYLLLVVRLPKLRGDTAAPEALDTCAFICVSHTVKQVGEAVGVREAESQHARTEDGVGRKGQGVALHPLYPVDAFSRDQAEEMADVARTCPQDIILVGGGALGSQVYDNLVRMGIGRWTIIDRDRVLPHNLARHNLGGGAVGQFKATALAAHGNHLLNEPIATGIIADVLDPGESADSVAQAMGNADVIVDATASVAVARHLARDAPSAAPRVSLFLNPRGTDGVMLAEDRDRAFPLDHLEMEYYRAAIRDERLADHMLPGDGPLQYARACHDRTNRFPQERVALQAALLTNALRARLSRAGSEIIVWRVVGSDSAVERISVKPAARVEVHVGEWTLCASQAMLADICRAREERLPCETGGVLIGTVDTQRRVIYAFEMVPSPPDSEEWPSSYVRGCAGLRARIAEIGSRTLRQAGYIGEWHSHPRGHGVAPSDDDRKALSWLAEELRADGMPAVMLIAGDDDEHAWFVDLIS